LESIPEFELSVYNRYGQMVFHQKDGIVNWDGTFNGKPLDAGTYVYLLDRKKFGKPLRGTLIIIR
jgi:hypothetical protein